MQQTFQRHFYGDRNSKALFAEIQLQVNYEAQMYFNKEVKLINEHTTTNAENITLYTAVYSPKGDT